MRPGDAARAEQNWSTHLWMRGAAGSGHVDVVDGYLGLCALFSRPQPEPVSESGPPRITHELILSLLAVVQAARLRPILEIAHVSKSASENNHAVSRADERVRSTKRNVHDE